VVPSPASRSSGPDVGPPPAGLDASPATFDDAPPVRAAKLCLAAPTDPRWTEVAMSDLPRTMLDHAWCEKKAAATALSMVSRYPEDPELVREMIALAHEEWSHFERIHAILVERDVRFGREERDPYVNELVALSRPAEPHRYLDRMLVAAFIEARSCERFALLAEALPGHEASLAAFYRELFVSEARHYTMFVRLALRRVERDEVRARVAEMAAFEADLVSRLPLAPRMH